MEPVDYLGLAHELKLALATYTESGGHGETAIDQEEAVVALLKCHSIVSAYFQELIKIVKDMRDADQRGEASGLTDEERAFYDALADNESAVQAMGSKELRVIATELVTQVRKSVTIDWTLRESARAKIKVMVKRILRKHGYPPDLQEAAVKTVLAQAELLCTDWAA